MLAMASNSLLVLCARGTHQLVLSPVKRLASARRLLLLCLELAISLFLALLLPRLLHSLQCLLLSHYPLLAPAPIFLFSNLLILVIVLSASPSSHSFVFPSTLVSHSVDDSNILRSSSPSELPLQSVSRHKLAFSSPQLKKNHQLQRPQKPLKRQDVFVSECQHEPLDAAVTLSSGSGQSAVRFMSSQRAITKMLPTILQTCAPAVPESEISKHLATAEGASNQEPEKQLAVKERATEHHYVVASTSSRIARSKSDKRLCDSAATSTKTLRRTEAVNDASMVRGASCDDKSSMIVTDLPPIESLSDEDANERFTEFIAKSLATMKKESQECRD